MKTYFYASYMLNVNEPDVCAIIKAQSQAQIKRACMWKSHTNLTHPVKVF